MIDLRTAFRFQKTPFTREIRTEDRFRLPFADEALEGLHRCVEARMSGALIAPAGTGKTVLLRCLKAALPEARFQVRDVKVTDLSKRDLCREIALACDAPPAGSYNMLVRRLQERFEQAVHVDGRRPVLLLDEAQDLRVDSLPIVRLLTNFEMDSRLVLSVVLCGTQRVKALLERADQEAVARRIYHYATLRLLSRDELLQYVKHRCTLAGATTVPFDERALDAVFEIGRGNLRATDQLALKALELADQKGADTVDHMQVIEARRLLWP